MIILGILEYFFYFLDKREVKFLYNLVKFGIFVFGWVSYEDFILKGYDIIVDVVGFFGEKFKVIFVGV